MTASAIWATTSAECIRRRLRPPSARGLSSRSTSAGFVLDICSAGSAPATQSAADRGREQEQQDAHVEVHGLDSRKRAGGEGPERHGTDPREEQSDRASEERQHDALGQRLAEEAPLRGAERGSHGELGSPCGGAGEDEIGDVRARDQQDKSDRTEQQPQRPFGCRADHPIRQRVGDARRTWRSSPGTAREVARRSRPFRRAPTRSWPPARAGRGRRGRRRRGSARRATPGRSRAAARAATSAVGSSNSGGITPTISTSDSFRRTVLPMTPRSAPIPLLPEAVTDDDGARRLHEIGIFKGAADRPGPCPATRRTPVRRAPCRGARRRPHS